MSDKLKDKDIVKTYFADNAESWLLDAYDDAGYNYPVGFHRVRIVRQIMPKLNNVQNVIDVGCGGGQLACALALQGFDVLGVDQSETMIASATQSTTKLNPEVAGRLRFQLGSLQDIKSTQHDAVTAMGVIGYLPSDTLLFEIGSRLLRDKGYMVISFRNRLFNLYSITNRTIREVENGTFAELVNEASEYYQQFDRDEFKSLLISLHAITGRLLDDGALDKPVNFELSPSKAKGKKYSSTIEARQTSPKQAIQIAKDCGFDTVQLYGVHPHITLPAINELLPFQIYNRLSDALIPLEATPISLLWSSVFIGVFQKR